jgi:hypothetical protein
VSAGEVTMGSLQQVLDEPSQPSEPSEPSPPAPSVRAPPRGINPRRHQTAQIARARPVPGDPDDDVETVDQQHEFSVSRQMKKQTMIIVAACVALAAIVLLAVALWPAGDPEQPKAPTAPKNPVTVEDGPKPQRPVNPPEPPAEGAVRVQIRAVKGTQLLLDTRPLAPDDTILRKPGELVLKFTCPPKRKIRSPPGTLRAQIPDSDQLVVVEVPCR